MSAPFEFSYQNPETGNMSLSKTPELCLALNDYINAEYDEDTMAFGILAFDDDKNLVGIRTEAYGRMDEEGITDVTGEGFPGVITWMEGLGVSHLFTWVRRAPTFGHGAQVGQWDQEMCETTERLADRVNLNYQGHIITTGTEHGLMKPMGGMSESDVAPGIAGLLHMVSPQVRAAIAREALAKMMRLHPDLDPDIIEGIEAAIAMSEADEYPEDMNDPRAIALDNAIAGLENLQTTRLSGAQAADHVAPKTDEAPQRPPVPKAFLN